MNPLTNVKNITKLNEIELKSGLIHKKSWHDIYKDSAWIFIGGLEYGLTEGDIITVFSQYGEVVNINLVRDKKTGKSKGYCFLCYANQKSTVLAVDNLNAIKLCNRTIRVDHVSNYKPPKEDERDDETTKMLKSEGCAPKHLKINENNIVSNDQAKKKKGKKEKKEKKKKKRKHSSPERDLGNKFSSTMHVKIKKEKTDLGYDKYDTSLNKFHDNEANQKRQERNSEHSQDESSHSHERFRSRSDQFYHEDKFYKKHKPKERSTSESQHKEAYKEKDKDHVNLSRKAKRKQSSSSSSDNSSRNHNDSIRCRLEKSQSKNKHSDSERRLQGYEQSTSSSSDEDSSSQSSTDDEKHESDDRNSKKDKYKRYEEKKAMYEERRDKNGHRRDNSNYASHRISDCDRTGRDFEYRSRGKYKSDERDGNNYRDSYHRSRSDKR